LDSGDFPFVNRPSEIYSFIMPYEMKLRRRVEFSETDMAGIVHYSNFFRYMEAAEHAFFRSLGFSIVTRNTEPPVGWPRVHAHCDYHSPLRFEDEFEIQLLVSEKKSKALSYQVRFFKLGDDAREVARGRLTVVCVLHNADGSMNATHIPAEIADKIEVAPAGLLGQ
jgi:YbgC/YbaW family acyl-CoA thioester hydrolase